MTYYDSKTIRDMATPGAWSPITLLSLDDGDIADNPTSTKWDFRGPGTIRYHYFNDGGIDVMVMEGTTQTEKRKK